MHFSSHYPFSKFLFSASCGCIYKGKQCSTTAVSKNRKILPENPSFPKSSLPGCSEIFDHAFWIKWKSTWPQNKKESIWREFLGEGAQFWRYLVHVFLRDSAPLDVLSSYHAEKYFTVLPSTYKNFRTMIGCFERLSFLLYQVWKGAFSRSLTLSLLQCILLFYLSSCFSFPSLIQIILLESFRRGHSLSVQSDR